jgi:hypothetical protein
VHWTKISRRGDSFALISTLLIGIQISLVFWLAMVTATKGGQSPPVDDSFIYFQYARSIASGHLFSYIPGDPPTTGATSFLYPLLLAPGFLMGLDGSTIVVYAYLLNTIFLLATTVLVYFLTRHLTNRYLATLAAALVVLSGPILWGFFSLMEIGLLSLATTLVAYLYTCERLQALPWKTLLASSLLALCRPEGIVISAFIVLLASVQVAPVIGHWLHSRSGVGRDSHSRAWQDDPLASCRKAWLAGLALLLPLGVSIGYLWFIRELTGSMATNTFLSKAIQTVPLVPWYDKLGMAANNAGVLLQNPFGLRPTYLPILVFPLLGLGLARHLGAEVYDRKPGIGILGVGILLIMVISASQLPSAFAHHFRYIMAIFPLALVFVMVGLGVVARFSPEGLMLSVGLSLLLLVLTTVNTPKWVQTYAQNASDIYFQQVSLAHWLRFNIPADSIVALNDAGAIAFYSGHPVYDLIGLVTNGASLSFRHKTGAIFERVLSLPPEERPMYYAIFPNWFALPEGDFLTEVFRTQLHRRTISSGAIVVVYRADYSVADKSGSPGLERQRGGLWTLVDSLNVAELADEARHNYHQFDFVPRGKVAVTVLRELSYAEDDQISMVDGGRIILGGEEFTIATQPGKSLKVVLRTDAAVPITLRVYINDKYVKDWSYPKEPGAWVEPYFIVPGSLVPGNFTRLRLELADNYLTSPPRYAPFYYWFYQLDIARPAGTLRP